MTKSEAPKIRNILISLLDRPEDPDRLSIDPEYIKELAASIAERGLLQPIILRPNGSRFEIVAGDCRYQAFLSLGRDTIPAIVKEMDAASVSLDRATENLQRRDLTIIEEARIYKNLHERHDMTWDQIAKRTGKTPGNVKRRYDLLKLPEMLIKALHEKTIGYAVAEELNRLKDSGKIEYYLGWCVDHGATRSVVCDWVKEALAAERQPKSIDGGGEWGLVESGSRPTYLSCDLCHGPEDVMRIKTLRICEACHATIKANI